MDQTDGMTTEHKFDTSVENDAKDRLEQGQNSKEGGPGANAVGNSSTSTRTGDNDSAGFAMSSSNGYEINSSRVDAIRTSSLGIGPVNKSDGIPSPNDTTSKSSDGLNHNLQRPQSQQGPSPNHGKDDMASVVSSSSSSLSSEYSNNQRKDSGAISADGSTGPSGETHDVNVQERSAISVVASAAELSASKAPAYGRVSDQVKSRKRQLSPRSSIASNTHHDLKIKTGQDSSATNLLSATLAPTTATSAMKNNIISPPLPPVQNPIMPEKAAVPILPAPSAQPSATPTVFNPVNSSSIPSVSLEYAANIATLATSTPMPSSLMPQTNAITTAMTASNTTAAKNGPSTTITKKTMTRPRSNSVPHNFTATGTTSHEQGQTTARAQAVPILSKREFTPSTSTKSGTQTKKNNSPSSSSSPSKSGQLRRGKWTVEEEAYVARVIQDFNSGYLDAPAGTTLRTFLSEKLNCDPMRITKKFTGDACIGKRVFHPVVRAANNSLAIAQAQEELRVLEERWRKRLEMQQKESAKKQAASAAAAAAAAVSGAVSGRYLNLLPSPQVASSTTTFGNNPVVTQTASWLDRANAILSSKKVDGNGKGHVSNSTSQVSSEEKEMKEVQRLIHEGPIIQKTSAGITSMLSSNSKESVPNNNASEQNQQQQQEQPSISSSSKAMPTPASDAPGATSLPKPKYYTDRTDFQSTGLTYDTTGSRNNVNKMQLPAINHFGIPEHSTQRMKKSLSTSYLPSSATESTMDNAAEDAATLMGFFTSVREAAASSRASAK